MFRFAKKFYVDERGILTEVVDSETWESFPIHEKSKRDLKKEKDFNKRADLLLQEIREYCQQAHIECAWAQNTIGFLQDDDSYNGYSEYEDDFSLTDFNELYSDNEDEEDSQVMYWCSSSVDC